MRQVTAESDKAGSKARLLLYLPFVGADSLASAALPPDNAKYQLEDYQPEAYGYDVAPEIDDERAELTRTPTSSIRGAQRSRSCRAHAGRLVC
jgi:hypothetical protein